ncbi:MAG TPA: antitoxin family protein [Tepidisphaeraceae bacterium]
MSIIRAVYEGGVFRPTERVDLPEHIEVEFEPRVVAEPARNGDLNDVYAVLSERYASGERDTAARHNEHQP